MGWMMWVLLAASAADGTSSGAGPRLANPDQVARIGDLTGNSLPSNHEGVVFAAVTVDPFGTPVACAITRTSGYAATDARTCALLRARAHFIPATDQAGTLIFSVYPVSVRWAVGGGAAGYLVDMTVEVKQLPQGPHRPVTIVRQIIGADGGLEGCAVETGSGSERLDAVACKQAEGLAKLGPVRDRAGKPVRTMRLLHVAFEQADD